MSEQPIYVPALDGDGLIPAAFLPESAGLTDDQAVRLNTAPLILDPRDFGAIGFVLADAIKAEGQRGDVGTPGAAVEHSANGVTPPVLHGPWEQRSGSTWTGTITAPNDTAAVDAMLARIAQAVAAGATSITIRGGGRCYRHEAPWLVQGVQALVVEDLWTLSTTDGERGRVYADIGSFTTVGSVGHISANLSSRVNNETRAAGFGFLRVARMRGGVKVFGARSVGIGIRNCGDIRATLETWWTRADGVHVVDETVDAVIRPVVRYPGDDGASSVSYSNDRVDPLDASTATFGPNRDVLFTEPDIVCEDTLFVPRTRWADTIGGRGILLNGTDIHVEGGRVTQSAVAGIMAAVEIVAGSPGYSYHPAVDCGASGTVLDRCRTNTAIAHAAITVLSDAPGLAIRRIRFEDITVIKPEIGLFERPVYIRPNADGTSLMDAVELIDFKLVGGAFPNGTTPEDAAAGAFTVLDGFGGAYPPVIDGFSQTIAQWYRASGWSLFPTFKAPGGSAPSDADLDTAAADADAFARGLGGESIPSLGTWGVGGEVTPEAVAAAGAGLFVPVEQAIAAAIDSEGYVTLTFGGGEQRRSPDPWTLVEGGGGGGDGSDWADFFIRWDSTNLPAAGSFSGGTGFSWPQTGGGTPALSGFAGPGHSVDVTAAPTGWKAGTKLMGGYAAVAYVSGGLPFGVDPTGNVGHGVILQAYNSITTTADSNPDMRLFRAGTIELTLHNNGDGTLEWQFREANVETASFPAVDIADVLDVTTGTVTAATDGPFIVEVELAGAASKFRIGGVLVGTVDLSGYAPGVALDIEGYADPGVRADFGLGAVWLAKGWRGDPEDPDFDLTADTTNTARINAARAELLASVKA